MDLISISEFRKKIKFYITEVITGKKRILIKKHKKPVAILSPVVLDSGEDAERCDHCGRLIGEILND